MEKGGKPGKTRHSLYNVENWGWVEEKSTLPWLCGCRLRALFVNLSTYHCTMDEVHTFENYIPIKVIKDKERKWVFVGWLLK